MSGCPKCGGERWVCEEHPEKPWNDDGCMCGAGMPCAACNPCDEHTPPAMPPGLVTIWSAAHDEGDGTFEGMPVQGGIQ